MNVPRGPDDIDLGDELIDVTRQPRAGVVVSVRLSAEEADRLQAIAEGRHTTLSRVAREAIERFLASGGGMAPPPVSLAGTPSGS